ncbi:MAG: hypothetical protein ABWZ74_09960, partial [Hyphomicrobiaceae bacterium]
VGGYPVTSVAAVIDSRYVNTGRIDVAGADINLGYAVDVAANRFDLGLQATYLARWREQLTPTSVTIDQRNVAGRPVDLRARATLGWKRGPCDALLGVNYVDHYRDLNGARIHSWTTLDLRFAYAPSEGILSGLTVALSAQNLLDQSPPFYDATSGAGYDAANADATGRFVALELTQRW